MVDPSPPFDLTAEKAALRTKFRQMRAAHVEALPQGLRALILNRPPAPVLDLMPEGTTVGLYHPMGAEAPSVGWARWLSENGRRIALPFFASRESTMEFRLWANPWDETSLQPGPWRASQPGEDADVASPDVVVVPLVAFTAKGNRLGQGGGHYDRWLAAHPHVTAIGLAWDCQLAENLPVEPHDRPLAAVITPTRIYNV